MAYVSSDPALKAVFVAADGLSALLELLDCPSERVRTWEAWLGQS